MIKKESEDKMNILIVEDDYDFACVLKKKIDGFMTHIYQNCDFHICHENYVNECSNCHCDMAFVDIHLEDQNSGVELAQLLVKENSKIIIVFVTSTDNLMHDTFKVQPFYYIRKKNFEKDFLSFCQLFKKEIKTDNYITLSYDHIHIPVNKSSICYVEVYYHVLYIYTENRVYKDKRSLKKFIVDLNDKNFIQVHKSFAIHLNYVYGYSKEKIILKNKNEIKIGRGFFKNFETLYKKYLIS